MSGLHFATLVSFVFPKAIKSIVLENEGVVINIDKEYLLPLLTFLKLNSSFQMKELLDVCGTDYPEREDRFEILYALLSVRYAKRLFLKLRTSEANAVSSAVSIYNSAGWLEREVWDMYGVFFGQHPDLRRILTDYGFEGFPLRKDFPLSGYTEVRYDDSQKKIVVEPLEMQQEFRYFDFVTPWDWHRKE
jgi:NADH/F420H2 dehydrogenase subunit C